VALVVEEHTHNWRPLTSRGRLVTQLCWGCIPKPRWTHALTLDDSAVRALRSGKLGSAGREGKAAYLAYVVLGMLLARKPEAVRSKVDRFRRSLSTRASQGRL
jgi:hypothetical protein